MSHSAQLVKFETLNLKLGTLNLKRKTLNLKLGTLNVFTATKIICVVACLILASCTHRESPNLDGRWVGSYAMFPAIFTFHGDSVAVTLAGKFAEERFEHADSNNNTLIHVIRPNIWMKLVFHGDDSATVVLNPRERIEIARQKY